MNDLFDLTDKVALVTGGSRGLGRELVKAFAQAGADVIISSRKKKACEELAAEVEQSTGRKAIPLSCHVGCWNQIDDLVDVAYKSFRRIDILVNNAGISPIYRSLNDVSENLYDKVLDVNLKGPFRLMVLIGSRMAADQGGSIINISSIAAIRPQAHVIPYSAGKAGLNAMTVGFAHALAPKVRVNCIMCGPFLTDISKAWNMASFKEQTKTFALRRGGEPHEIVGAALYFASNASSFCTGAILRLDGGTP